MPDDTDFLSMSMNILNTQLLIQVKRVPATNSRVRALRQDRIVLGSKFHFHIAHCNFKPLASFQCGVSNS